MFDLVMLSMPDDIMDERDVQGPRVDIAIVEDEKDLVRVYEQIFPTMGIIIRYVAYDGEEAIKKFIECYPRPYVILMDYRLPTIDGIVATREILKIDPAVRIIFISSDFGVKEQAMRAGAYYFLKKPASIKDIVAVVKAAGRAG